MLKGLFFILLLLNCSFLLWGLRSHPDPIPQTNPQLPSLQLAAPEPASKPVEASVSVEDSATTQDTPNPTETMQAEANQASVTASIDPSPATDHTPAPTEQTQTRTTETEKVCLEAGPFANAADLKRWANRHAISVDNTYYRDSASLAGYQVYYPIGKAADAQSSAKQLLISKGINDMWLMTEDPRHLGLSLGVFTDKARALSFKAELQQRGLTTEIQERHKTQPQLFAKFHTDKNRVPSLPQADTKLSPCNPH